MSFAFRSAADLATAYETRKTTPREVCERALAAAEALDRMDPPMRVFLVLDAAGARAAADASTQRWQAGRPLGPLDGVPFAVKDEYDVKGLGTTCGTAWLGRSPAAADALAVARLREAGAVLLGKTNMHELGMAPSGVNPHHGVCRNPYDPARDTGGSSSGSGAAVAAGVCPIALGNDGGGSIRVPGALCGVPGIKPTYGLVPTDGVPVLCWSLEHSGPLGATVGDVGTALAVITGAAPGMPAFDASRCTLGICDRWWEMATPEVAAITRGAIDDLVKAGARVRAVDLPHIEYAAPVGFATFAVEGAASVEQALRAGEPMSTSVRVSFDIARGIPAVTYVQAQRVRTLIARDFDRALAEVDLLVTPTTAITAPRYRPDAFATGELDEVTMNALVAFTFPQNLTGLPAAQVPCGFDRNGMPVGLQLVAARGADTLTLAAAREVERRTTRRRPRVWSDLLE